MGCCAQRGKLDNFATLDTEIFTFNSIPSYENISEIYHQIGSMPLLTADTSPFPHRKEAMIFMIINLLRVRPKIFMYQMESLKSKYDRGSKPRTMMFY